MTCSFQYFFHNLSEYDICSESAIYMDYGYRSINYVRKIYVRLMICSLFVVCPKVQNTFLHNLNEYNICIDSATNL